MKDYKLHGYIGDPPEPQCFVNDVVSVDYIIKALGTRLKYCPDQKVGIILSPESARLLLKALKDGRKGENNATD